MCSGVGGLDLAVERVFGARTVWFSEPDPSASLVLDTHWPGVKNHGDLTAVGWNSVEPVNILTAGYPCQPFSHAGLHGGENDPRHLWPHIRASLDVLRPWMVVLENVQGHVKRGLPEVLADLDDAGYGARWMTLNASDVGAPHRRTRVFVLASRSWRGTLRLHHRTPREDKLRPTLRSRDHAGAGIHGRGGHDLRTTLGMLFPTPLARDSKGLSAPGRSGPPGLVDVLQPADALRDYRPALQLWKTITGREHPYPVEPASRGDRVRVNPRFSEWMMGWPEGWVDVGIPFTHQTRLIGNGVVDRQAEAALHVLMDGGTDSSSPATGTDGTN